MYSSKSGDAHVYLHIEQRGEVHVNARCELMYTEVFTCDRITQDT